MPAAIALLLLPLLLAGASWWSHKAHATPTVPVWRKSLFTIGLCCVSISASVLAAFGIHAYIISRGTTSYDLDLAYPIGSMMVLALAAALLALFGQRISRILMLGTGLGTLTLWYIAALGASP